MTDLFYIVIAISILFFALLGIKELLPAKLKQNFCVICASVVIVWASLLVLYWLGRFNNPIILALLMGETVLGIYYVVESKVKDLFKMFRLPFLLTAIVAFYALIDFSSEVVKSAIFIIFLWVVFGFIYLYRDNSDMQKIVQKAIACCKRW